MSRPELGSTIGGYRVESILGEGGMGVVFAATQLSLNRPVALKVLHVDLALDADSRARFVQEGKVAARVQHPRIVKVLEVGQHEGRLFLASELIEGQTLRQRLDRVKRLPAAEAVEVATACAEALSALHGAGVLHRDIKPENIFLAGARGPLVGDLGIAKDLLGGGTRTQQGLLVGTPAYMAPELVLGKPASAASDLYAIGIMLHECLSGGQPFRAEDPVELLRLHGSAPIPNLARSFPGLPRELTELCSQLLAKEPKDRPASAKELKEALDALPPLDRGLAPMRSSSATVQVAMPQGPARTSRVRQTATVARPPSRVPLLIAAGALAGLLGVAIFVARRPSSPPPAPPPPVALVGAPQPPAYLPAVEEAERAMKKAENDGHDIRLKHEAKPLDIDPLGCGAALATLFESALGPNEKALVAGAAAAKAGTLEAYARCGNLMALLLGLYGNVRGNLWGILGARQRALDDHKLGGILPELNNEHAAREFEDRLAHLSLALMRRLPPFFAESREPEWIGGRACLASLTRQAVPPATLKTLSESLLQDVKLAWPKLAHRPENTAYDVVLLQGMLDALRLLGIENARLELVLETMTAYRKLPAVGPAKMLVWVELAIHYAYITGDSERGPIAGGKQTDELALQYLLEARRRMRIYWKSDADSPIPPSLDPSRTALDSLVGGLRYALRDCIKSTAGRMTSPIPREVFEP